ncbi:SURF1 family protein [Pseudoroseicyclus aestuarii]|uniref:SURF1-like protein n=1 Tax=Pseudoroseicyclus aestuarii TaxID=1795041 RepID=A0A318SUG2_9RHOB|nr:SURF1 family protein [Pseudoroseicyclus aestuarii]PYE85112.1 surfeit locus 1 family protein [Pseudoroseicyclus aestuarii]
MPGRAENRGPDRPARSHSFRRLAPLVGAGLFCALFVALGVWQLQRLAWKTDLIDRVEARLAAAPVAAPGPQDWSGLSEEADEYRRIEVSGTYAGQSLPVLAVTVLGRGYWVMTPLETADGWSLLVNRGFVADDRAAEGLPEAPSGEVTVEGLLRLSQPGGAFLRSNAPEEGRWYSRDTGAMAEVQGLNEVAPYFLDMEGPAEAGAEAPVPGLTVVDFRNTHLTYALTWFVLAILSVVALVLLLRRRG